MATADKYDRQLRLWGAEGQRALMEAHILLVNADGTGSETLKNLVLPGVGRFTVMDGSMVEAADCGSNFFVTRANIGEPRAVVVTGLLCEMNSDVAGTPIVLGGDAAAGVAQVIAHIWSTRFTTVVLSNPSTALLTAVSLACWEQSTPLLVLRTMGLLGYMRLQLREQHVTASAGALYDLRIFNPFPGLHDYCSGFNLPELSSAEHGHVPYIVILYQAMQQWKAGHGGLVPQSYADKKAFAGNVQSMARNRHSEVNFEEALNNSFRAYAPIRVPEQVHQMK
jgi:amyloid beta precursor protein binding protein 1